MHIHPLLKTVELCWVDILLIPENNQQVLPLNQEFEAMGLPLMGPIFISICKGTLLNNGVRLYIAILLLFFSVVCKYIVDTVKSI